MTNSEGSSEAGAVPAQSIVARLRATYGAKAALDRRDSVVSAYLYRPISFYATVPFVRWGWTPNQVTALGVGIAVIGAGLLASGRYDFAVVGSLCCAIQTILDYVDGNIARLRGSSSHIGKFVDGIADTSVNVLIVIAVGIGIYMGGDALVPSGSPVRAAFLLGGALTAILMTLQALLVFRLRAASFEAGWRPESVSDEPGTGRSKVRMERLASTADTILRFEGFAMLVGIVIFALLNVLSLYLVIRFSARAGSLILEGARTFVLARRRLVTARSV